MALPGALAVVVLGGAAALASGGGGGSEPAHRTVSRTDTDPVLTPDAVKAAARSKDRERARRSHGRVVRLEGVGSRPAPSGDARDNGPSPGAQSDAEVRAELKAARAALQDFRRHLATAVLQTGARARVLSDGSAQAPDDAPDVVKQVILAGNEIAKFPYKWGGGHGAWRDTGYDCSGSVSFALAGARLLGRPLTSGDFMGWGDPGPGRWITIYASPGHVFMFVAGLRFDTSGRGRAGTRWQAGGRGAAGFAVRHPRGL